MITLLSALQPHWLISKVFTFEASHRLRGLPAGHKCGRHHGHSYTVELLLAAPAVDEIGFVVDYGDLDAFKHYLDSTFDHQHLNDVVPVNPTAENLARHFFEWAKTRWPELVAVRVRETAKTSALYMLTADPPPDVIESRPLPTVGRIVTFTDHAGATYAAIITAVLREGDAHSPVMLTIFLPGFDPLPLREFMEYGPGKREGWGWPVEVEEILRMERPATDFSTTVLKGEGG